MYPQQQQLFEQSSGLFVAFILQGRELLLSLRGESSERERFLSRSQHVWLCHLNAVIDVPFMEEEQLNLVTMIGWFQSIHPCCLKG